MIKNTNVKTRKRLFAFIMAATLLLSGLSVFASDSDTLRILSVDIERFMTDTVNASGGSLSSDKDKNVIVSLNGAEASLSMDIKRTSFPEGANSLRVVLVNDTLCESMTVEYMYKTDGGIQSSGSVGCELVKGSGAVEYILPVEACSRMTSMKLTFNGALSGEITIMSISPVSYYNDGRTYVGELTKNECDVDTGRATFSGHIDWETVSANEGAKIVVYRLKHRQSLGSVRPTDDFIASCDISLDFNLSFSLKNSTDICSRYAVAVLTEDGNILPITAEIYLSPKRSGSKNTEPVGFKGIESGLYAGVIEAAASVTVIDVYLDKMVNDGANGLQYILDNEEYYIDSEYISELDLQVRSCVKAGVDVYFRILVGNGGYDSLFNETDPYEKAKYYFADIYSDEVITKLYVYTDYILTRYSERTLGSVRGIIIGRGLNDAAKYNYCQGSVSLEDYSDMIARYCAILSNVTSLSDPSLELILPVADGQYGMNYVQPIDNRENVYPLDMLLMSVFEYLDQYGVDMTRLFFMMESDHSVLKDSDAEAVATSGISDRIYSGGAMRCLSFNVFLQKITKKYPDLSNRFTYCWYASGSNLIDDYIFNYSVAANISNIKSFIVSLSERKNDEDECFDKLRDTLVTIDTDKCPSISEDSLRELGIAGIRSIMSNYAAKNLERRRLTTLSFSHSIPGFIKGSYKMWDFGFTAGNVGWEALYGCRALSVYTVSTDIGRALVANFSGDQSNTIGAEYGSIIYTQANTLRVKEISGLSLDLYIPETDEEMVYEVKVSVSSGDHSIECSGVVFSGVETVLYADVREIDEIESIKITVKDLSSEQGSSNAYNICIKNISIHSEKYDDDELQKMVMSGELVSDSAVNKTDDSLTALKRSAAFVGISVAVVLVIWAAYSLRKKFETD